MLYISITNTSFVLFKIWLVSIRWLLYSFVSAVEAKTDVQQVVCFIAWEGREEGRRQIDKIKSKEVIDVKLIFIFKEMMKEQNQEKDNWSHLKPTPVVLPASPALPVYEKPASQVHGDCDDHRKQPRDKEVLKGDEALRGKATALLSPWASHVPWPPVLCGSFILGSRWGELTGF